MAAKLGKEETPAQKAQREAVTAAAIDGNVTEDAFLQSIAELVEINTKLAAVNEARKAIRKTIKARGIELGDLDAVVRMADWSREEVTAVFQRRAKYAAWLGLPNGHQVDMFDGDDTEAANKSWEARGFTAARAAQSPKPPEECPERFHAAWAAGHERGLKAMQRWQPDPGKKKTAPKEDPEVTAAFDKAEAEAKAEADARAAAKAEAKAKRKAEEKAAASEGGPVYAEAEAPIV